VLLHEASTELFLASIPTGAAVGYVQCRYRYSAWRLALEAELEDVFVVREVRRRGVGQRLVAFAIARATAKGCRSLGLSTNERNTAAVTLYQRLGFVAVCARWQGGRQLWLQRTLEPA
jgi:ribosomal protein S18 acetylase RimI-like enzyme